MKVVHLCTSDTQGGAAIAAHRQHTGLRGLGCDSSMFVLRKSSGTSHVTQFTPPDDIVSKASRYGRHMLLKHRQRTVPSAGLPDAGQFSSWRTKYGAQVDRELPRGDIFNLHWVSGFLDLTIFFKNVRVPVVWTLHDMNPFTGGCHLDGGCGKFTESCGACPQLRSSKENDLSRKIWKDKRRVLGGIRSDALHIVGNSHWTTDLARRSSLMNRFSMTTIHCGIDTKTFAPRSKREARAVLGIPEQSRVIAFGAHAPAVPMKGFGLLREALEGLSSDGSLNAEHFLLSFGWGSDKLEVGLPHRPLNYIHDDGMQSLVYSAADVFVIPSLQESFGQTALEAMACGVPVVGFETGGLPEIVRTGETGQLVPTGNVRALREGISRMLSDESAWTRISKGCRSMVVDEFSLETQARKYLDVYEGILAES